MKGVVRNRSQETTARELVVELNQVFCSPLTRSVVIAEVKGLVMALVKSLLQSET